MLLLLFFWRELLNIKPILAVTFTSSTSFILKFSTNNQTKAYVLNLEKNIAFTSSTLFILKFSRNNQRKA